MRPRYERFDERGGLHLWQYEAHSYALMMRNTGKIYSIPGLPVPSRDETRYAYAACSLPDGMTDKGEAEIGILSIVEGRSEIEAKAAMPCGAGACKIEWDGAEALGAACGNGSSGSVWMTRFLRKGRRLDVKSMISGRLRDRRPAGKCASRHSSGSSAGFRTICRHRLASRRS